MTKNLFERTLHDVKGATPEYNEQAKAVICALYSDVAANFANVGLPLPPHRKEPCSKCGAELIVSTLSPVGPPRMCPSCVEKEYPPETHELEFTTHERAMPLVEMLRHLDLEKNK